MPTNPNPSLPPLPPLNEAALRRPDFRGGTVLTLADGQDWTFAQPQTLWVADDSEAGAQLGTDLGPAYDALEKAIEAATTIGETARATMKAATYLLRLNYDLDSAALGQILRVDFSVLAATNPRNQESSLARDLLDVVAGNIPAPKASADGDGSPSSPTESTPPA